MQKNQVDQVMNGELCWQVEQVSRIIYTAQVTNTYKSVMAGNWNVNERNGQQREHYRYGLMRRFS